MNKTVIHINSAQRASGTSQNFTIDIGSQLALMDSSQTDQTPDSIAVLSFNMPKSYYLINSSNNTWQVNENGTLHTVTLTPGNYSATTLVTEIKTRMTSAGLAYTYNTIFSSITGRLTWTASNVTGAQPSFIFPSTSFGIYRIIGFDRGQTAVFSANSLTSTNIINLQLANSISVMSNLTSNEGGLLATIVNNTADFSSITYNNSCPEFTSRQLTTGTNASTIIKNPTFYLLNNETGLELDLNGLNWSMVLVLYRSTQLYYNRATEYFAEMLKEIMYDRIKSTM